MKNHIPMGKILKFIKETKITKNDKIQLKKSKIMKIFKVINKTYHHILKKFV